MAASIDALTSPTLKYLRERWWNDDFTDFLAETLRPRPGNRILDVGCGEGTAEVRIGRLHVSQIRMVGVDLMIERVMVARHQTAGHNQRVAYATADACRLPFHDGVFDSTFCVAVLQHIADEETAVAELSRVTRPGGRVLAVEPDNRGYRPLRRLRGFSPGSLTRVEKRRMRRSVPGCRRCFPAMASNH
jgi:ubiquinone/menaquinone biosynthesis C-methylase UbiE